MLKRRTAATINHKNYNNVCLPLMTGSRISSSSSFINNNTDAILSEANYLLVNQPQKISISSQVRAQNPKSTVVPYSTLKLCQSKNKSFNNLTKQGQQQLVNSKTNSIIDNHYYKKQGSLKVKTYIKMMNLIYYLFALILFTLCALSTSTQFVLADGTLQSNIQKLKISQDSGITIPSYLNTIKVELHGNIVKPGDLVPAKNFKDLNLAKITWEVDNFEERHTLLLLDLDRKSGPNNTQNIYNQYTSLNIPGNIINLGQTIVAFDIPIVPCQTNMKHRILMLAFHQGQNIDISEVAYMSASSGQSSKRENFKLDDFINRHRLDLIAANVFQAVGETNGVCSGTVTLNSLQSVSSILIAMVIAMTAFGFSCRRSMVRQ